MNKLYQPDNDTAYWRDVPDYSGIYQVSRAGIVRRIFKTGVRDLTPYKYKANNKRTLFVKFGHGSKTKERMVHRIVWESWIGPVPDGMRVYHKNGILDDNRLDNLELATPEEIGRKSGDKNDKRKPVVKISESGEEVEIYKSAREAARQNFMSYQTVLDRCHKKVADEFALNGFTFRFEEMDGRSKKS